MSLGVIIKICCNEIIFTQNEISTKIMTNTLTMLHHALWVKNVHP